MEQMSSHSPFDFLPDHIIIDIFSYFDSKLICTQFAPICRRWHRLAYAKSLWRKLEVETKWSKNAKRNKSIAILLSKMCDIIHHLHINIYRQQQQSLPNIISTQLPFVTNIHLKHHNAFTATPSLLVFYATLIKQTPNVRSLKIDDILATDDLVNLLARESTWPHLQSLHFESLDSTTAACIAALLKSNKRFVDLNMYGLKSCVPTLAEYQYESISRLRLGSVPDDASVLALTKCTNLSSLLMFCEYLTDISLEYLKLMCKLHNLTLQKGRLFSEVGFCSLFDSNDTVIRQLQHFSIGGCSTFNDNCVDSFTKCCPNIETLTLICCSITMHSFAMIVDRLSNCRCLRVGRMRGNDDSTRLSANRLIDSPLFNSIQLINVRCADYDWIDDATAIELIKHKRHLVIINKKGIIFDWKNVDNSSIRKRKYCNYKHRIDTYMENSGVRPLEL